MAALVHRVQPGLYRTPDGLYEIQYEKWWLDGECECAMCVGGMDYACPNDGWGMREGWTVWDVKRGTHASGEPFSYESYREARDALVEFLAAAA